MMNIATNFVSNVFSYVTTYIHGNSERSKSPIPAKIFMFWNPVVAHVLKEYGFVMCVIINLHLASLFVCCKVIIFSRNFFLRTYFTLFIFHALCSSACFDIILSPIICVAVTVVIGTARSWLSVHGGMDVT